MILAGDLRKGVTFVYDGNIYVVVDFLHVKPGKGAAFVRTKLKNVVTGAVLEKTFNPTEKFEKAMIESKQMEYLYSDGELYYFMDPESYEQVPLTRFYFLRSCAKKPSASLRILFAVRSPAFSRSSSRMRIVCSSALGVFAGGVFRRMLRQSASV